MKKNLRIILEKILMKKQTKQYSNKLNNIVIKMLNNTNVKNVDGG